MRIPIAPTTHQLEPLPSLRAKRGNLVDGAAHALVRPTYPEE
ncbi:MAG: hypothetical protein OXF79_28960 [Chloroflexi bacterium]|nr:hypothetical protein [Chloroflexota bacterium]